MSSRYVMWFILFLLTLAAAVCDENLQKYFVVRTCLASLFPEVVLPLEFLEYPGRKGCPCITLKCPRNF
jgi:hypothetical protein